jgi:hypothetical protein
MVSPASWHLLFGEIGTPAPSSPVVVQSARAARFIDPLMKQTPSRDSGFVRWRILTFHKAGYATGASMGLERSLVDDRGIADMGERDR